MKEILKSLSEIDSICGHEQQLTHFIVSNLPINCSHKIDNLENLIVEKIGQLNSKNRVLLTSSIDEKGLLIKTIEPDGSLKFLTIGKINPDALVGSVVKINETFGVIGQKPVHLQTKEEKRNSQTIDNMFIDIGADNEQQVKNRIKIGNVATFKNVFLKYGENKIVAKLINSKIGCGLMLKILKSNFDYNFFCAFMTKTIVSTASATTIMNEIKPNIVIILTTFEEQINENLALDSKKHKNFRIVLNPTTNEKIFKAAIQTAKLNNFNYSIDTTNEISEIEKTIMQSQNGIKTLTISTPCRLINSPCSNFDLTDVSETLNFLKRLIAHLTAL